MRWRGIRRGLLAHDLPVAEEKEIERARKEAEEKYKREHPEVGGIDSISNNPEEWKSKIHRARKWSENHDLSWTAGELIRLLQAV